MNGSIDGLGIFLTDLKPDEYNNINYRKLMNLEFGVGVSGNHPYANMKSLTLDKTIKDNTPVIIYSLDKIEDSDLYYIIGEDKLKKLHYDITSSHKFYEDAIKSAVYIGVVCKNEYSPDYMEKNNVKILEWMVQNQNTP